MESYVDMPILDGLSESGSVWLKETLPSFDFGSFVRDLTEGKTIFQPGKIIDTILNIFAKEMYTALKILSVIIAIVMICALLENLRLSFNKADSINSRIVITVLLAGLAGELFNQTSTYAYTLSSDISKIMWAMLPTLITLIAGSGFVSTGLSMHPILYFMCNVFVEIFNRLLIPMSVAYFAISLADLVTDTIQLTNLRQLIRKTYNFILGIIMTFFTGILSISSFAGVSLDTVGGKGVKFVISNLVPFVGRSISDAMNSVAAASLLLKNAIGITGIVCMIALGLIPVLKIAVIIIAIRLSAAVCEPIAGDKTAEILSCMADSLSMINAALIATIIMMIIAVSIIVGIR